MISYDGVILKRLRFKGEPDVPEISAAEIGLIGVEASESTPAVEDREEKEENAKDDAVEDNRTEAEKRFAQKTAQQEQRRLRAAAAATYREQVDKFNERLAKEPEHYDLFKISFTK